MKLEKLLIMAAMPLALALSGCSQNINITNNKVDQKGSGNIATISNTSEQKQEISINHGSRRYNYNYFCDEIPGVIILSDSKSMQIQRDQHEFMVMQAGEEETFWKDISSLNRIPESYPKQFFDYTPFGSDYGKVAIYYSPERWSFIDVGGNSTPTFLFREKGFE